MVNSFDASILSAINSLAGRSVLFDQAMNRLAGSNVLKGWLFVSVLLWHWFRKGDPAAVRKRRDHIVCTVAAGICAIIVARALALSLPFRVRPRFAPEAHFQVPATWGPSDLIDWSSFPSDHAVLFAALAMGLVFISRRLGVLAFVYVALCIGFPRIYTGTHYPTDVLVGLLLGSAIGYIFNSAPIREPLGHISMRFAHSAPEIFYPAMFILSYQLATLFNDVRHLLVLVAK
jgi:undecaprenyl-diphosphatase